MAIFILFIFIFSFSIAFKYHKWNGNLPDFIIKHNMHRVLVVTLFSIDVQEISKIIEDDIWATRYNKTGWFICVCFFNSFAIIPHNVREFISKKIHKITHDEEDIAIKEETKTNLTISL